MVEGQQQSTSPLLVKKFGGTSVGSIERIEVIAEQVAKSFHQGERQVLVLSAMAGHTNHLFGLANQIERVPDARELDMLVSTGEQISVALMAMALQKRGLKARSLTGDQVQIHTNNQFGRASIERVDTDYLQMLLQQGIIPVVAGFQGRNTQGEVTTLGRGGSDTTAVAIAAALSAQECQIFTDVAGIYTTDPNIEPSAQKLAAISFDEMFEMARLGAKVLHPDSVSYAERFKVRLRVLSSFEKGSGTLVQFTSAKQPLEKVVGIAGVAEQAMISLPDLESGSESYQKIFQLLAAHGVEADLVSKTLSDKETICFTLNDSELDLALATLDSISQVVKLGAVHSHRKLAKLSLVGDGVFAKSDILAKVFETLTLIQTDAKMITTSDIKLSLVIDQSALHTAVRALHHAFELNKA
ncbi:aspartate kinase [Shewanella gelidii]|uniref:Aspartokinase n=1 Tax=Shewanella gelidii TaxID=1642821 RepID=A0A917JK94_9GAMM|nr:aspartate kinase [Shewanella gelidii]MCL1096579.1 aspartate kinase [Shewanella gelidii]GGI68555.1 aspartokinase [Shewanella gelidii]